MSYYLYSEAGRRNGVLEEEEVTGLITVDLYSAFL